ncbi:peroxiredoxin [Chitinophaga nivalis]|uniref:Redoxin family protein n=1 Tax=Chitinophaga nivalis TaxID=2991709 RepID=A0ABT3IH07_9BACT|nr:redoxin domain-containing protein [Chitinophaga nivalis]MCW3467083.1 redoxin family protein [Chitinophaga nivalis]MCW3483226.1 redoxin family protein [Chitinophaga nivalis]
MITDLTYLLPDLPVPEDDGACAHLTGMALPDIALMATSGALVRLQDISGRVVIYCYPMTGPAEVPLPAGWDEIPGARGCTPQACSFRDHYRELQQLNTQVFGMSTQMPAVQRTEKERIHLPFDLLSDEALLFSHALQLPLHYVEGLVLQKRVTLIVEGGKIRKYFYPVFPPDKNIDVVLEYLKEYCL